MQEGRLEVPDEPGRVSQRPSGGGDLAVEEDETAGIGADGRAVDGELEAAFHRQHEVDPSRVGGEGVAGGP